MAKRGREYWTKVLADLEQSGLKHREFATQREVSIHSLRTWLYKLRRTEKKPVAPKARAVRLLRVRVRCARGAAQPSALGLELAINGIGVRFAEGTSVHYVAELARALRDRC